MKRKTKLRIMIAAGVVFLILIGCGVFFVMNQQNNAIEKDGVPDFSGNVTQIRLKAVERSFHPEGIFNILYPDDIQPVQILYGYEMDGVWRDLPCENYNLIGFGKNNGKTDFEAAHGSHAVKIGPYVLLHFECQYYRNSIVHYEFEDTIHSEILEPFSNFYTDIMDSEASYGYLIENALYRQRGEKYNYHLYTNFNRQYYLILKIDEIPDDYELRVIAHSSAAVKTIFEISKDDILDWIGSQQY